MRILVILAVIALLATSCGRGITVQQAASGKAKCSRYIKN